MSAATEGLQVLLVGKNTSENILWGGGKILVMPLNRNSDLILGKYYILKSDQTLEAVQGSPYVTKAIPSKNADKEVRILVLAPIFIGNRLNAKQFIGCNDFFGRIFVDNTFSSVKLQQFKTYTCCIEFSAAGKLVCFWKSKRVITQSVESNMDCFMVHAKVDCVAIDHLMCTSDENQGEIEIRVERSDIQENCFDEIRECMPISIVYLPFFHGKYLSCFSTVRSDFKSQTLRKTPLVPISEEVCCDPNCGELFETLRILIGDTYFWEHTLANNPELRERLLNLFL